MWCSFYWMKYILSRSQFCTCHDNCAVVTCANLWPHCIIRNVITTVRITQDFNYEHISHLWNGPLMMSRGLMVVIVIVRLCQCHDIKIKRAARGPRARCGNKIVIWDRLQDFAIKVRSIYGSRYLVTLIRYIFSTELVVVCIKLDNIISFIVWSLNMSSFLI